MVLAFGDRIYSRKTIPLPKLICDTKTAGLNRPKVKMQHTTQELYDLNQLENNPAGFAILLAVIGGCVVSSS